MSDVTDHRNARWSEKIIENKISLAELYVALVAGEILKFH